MIAILYGTRPEYLKVVCLIDTLKKDGIPVKAIRVCQHEDLLEHDLRFDDCLVFDGVPPTVGRMEFIGSQILLKLGQKLDGITHALVQGDTATAFYSALVAFQKNLKIIHLEAGMRTYDLQNPYPEEAYRQMISRIASIHLAPHPSNRELLASEKTSGVTHVVGNTILDLVRFYDFPASITNDVLITFHRRENQAKLGAFMRQLSRIVKHHPAYTYHWVLHPNPELQAKVLSCLEQHGLLDRITVRPPMGHRDFARLLSCCLCALTDSGGVQEEAAFLGKPCIVLRNTTERDQIPAPYLQLAPNDFEGLLPAFERIRLLPALPPCHVYGDGTSCRQISKILKGTLPCI